MSAQTSRRGATSARGDIFLLILVTAVLGVVVSIGLLLAVGQTMAGQEPTWNPLQGLLEVMLEQRPWPAQATVLVILFLVLVLVLVVGVALGRSKRKGKRRGVDAAAATMQRPGAISGLGRADALKDAKRLRPSATFDKGDNPGILLGRTVRGDRPLFMNWESGALIMAGPRMGKSTSLAIPAIMEAPGAVVATSNKGDVHDATRLAREQAGGGWGISGGRHQRHGGGAQRCGVALGGDVFLDGDGHPVEQPLGLAALPAGFALAGLRQRVLRPQQVGGADVGLPALHVCQHSLRDLHGGQRALAVGGQQVLGGQVVQCGHGWGSFQ